MKDLINEAMSLTGRMTRDEVAWVYEQAKGHKIAIEIGVYRGRTTKILANICEKVFCIDPYFADIDMQYFLDNLRFEIEQNKILLIRQKSCDAIPFLRRNMQKADLIWIDGDHGYECVKQDIQNYIPLLSDDGILIGHDGNNKGQPGVDKALKECIPDFKPGVRSTWLWTKSANMPK